MTGAASGGRDRPGRDRPGRDRPDHDRPGPCAGHGRRERKKRQTRMALIDAALDLFQRKGYEATTIDEIVAGVPVSQRTFFRYFATKEDLVIGLLAEHDRTMLEALAERPADERPLTALFESLRVVLSGIAESDPADSARFRAVRKVIDANPSLLTAQMARLSAAERDLTEVVARRQGVDPVDDVRPHLVVAFYTAAIRVAFEDCARHDIWDPAEIASRVENTMATAHSGLPGWI